MRCTYRVVHFLISVTTAEIGWPRTRLGDRHVGSLCQTEQKAGSILDSNGYQRSGKVRRYTAEPSLPMEENFLYHDCCSQMSLLSLSLSLSVPLFLSLSFLRSEGHGVTPGLGTVAAVTLVATISTSRRFCLSLTPTLCFPLPLPPSLTEPDLGYAADDR